MFVYIGKSLIPLTNFMKKCPLNEFCSYIKTIPTILLSSLYEGKTETHIRKAHFLGCEL